MNPYDKAHELAREVARSQECQNMIQAKDAVKADAAASRMMNDFEKKQRTAYAMMQSGEEPSPEQLGELRVLMDVMRQNSVLAAYLQADARLGQLLNDIQRIIVDAVSMTRWEETES